MYTTVRNMRNLYLPVDLQLSMFDTIVTPIKLHGSGVWEIENMILQDN